jgi:N-acetylglucosaminyldiphosphoundecaprenol N-acetyl-beta-D-mannosaminyltransferase
VAPEVDRVPLFGCTFDRVTLDQAIGQVEAAIADRDTLTQSVGVNLDQLLKMQREPDFAKIILSCDQITADGQPVVWLSRLFRDPLPARVPSVDIMDALLPVAARKGYKIFMLGAKEESVQAAADNIEKEFPGIQIVGRQNGYFTPEDEPEIAQAINQSGADVLLIAISSPKKEEFVERNRAELQVPFVMGVGGAFDIRAGLTTRAPIWMRKTGVEWVWRFAQEPRRMGPRIIDDLRFSRYIVREWRQRRRARKAG